MLKKISDIFKKTAGSKIFWAGVLICLALSAINPTSAVAKDDDWDYECPSMEVLRERYQGECFPCQIVNVLLASFMRAASKVYDVSKEAGSKLLLLGSILWLAFWALKKMSSLANVEPAAMSNELVVFFGKVVVAYCFINAGIGTLVNYAVNPIMGAGADFGTALLLESQNMDISSAPKSENAYKGEDEIVHKSTMDKILKLSEGVSNEVAMNLVIGNALTCFSIKKGIHFTMFIDIHIPDIWLWLVGAAIWCAGFMFVLSVCYYLVDIPFKIGFAIIALPVVIGLWPFKITSGKLKDVVMVALNAAGTFLFLALSSSYAMRLISQSFSNVGSFVDDSGNTVTGTDALLYAISKDNVDAVENVFSFTGGSFLIIMFCYIYGIKMISQITQKYPEKFFSGSITAGAGSPLHHMATAATMWASKKAAAPFKMAGDIVAHQAGKAATTAAKAAGNVGIGVAGAAAGSVARSVGRRVQNFGQNMAEKAQKSKESWDSLDKYDQLHQTGMKATIGNKLGKFGSRVKLGLANTVAKTGEYVNQSGDYLAAPGQRTLGRVKNAWSKGTEEVGEAVKEFGQQLPLETISSIKGVDKFIGTAAQLTQRFGEKVNTLAEAGQDIIDETSESLEANMRTKKLRRLHPGKIVHKLTAPTLKAAAKTILTVSGKTGMMIGKVGEGVSSRQDSEEIKAQARQELSEALSKLGKSGRKVATYIPFTGVAASEGTLRHKFASLSKEKIKAAFSKKAIVSGIKSVGEGIGKTWTKGVVQPWQLDKESLKASRDKIKDDVINFHDDIDKKENDSLEAIMVSAKNFGSFKRMKADFSGAVEELKKSTTDLGQTLASEHRQNYASGTSVHLSEDAKLLGYSVLAKFSLDKAKIHKSLTKLGLDEAKINGILTKANKFATGASALVGTSAALQFGSGLGVMGGGAVAGRHLYNNAKEAAQETMAAWRDGKIDNLFDLAGAVAHPVMAIPLVLKNSASQTVESSYQVAEKTLVAGLDVALTATSLLKEPGRILAHSANIVGHGTKIVATPIMAGVNIALDAGEVAGKAVRLVTRPVVNTVATIAFAPVGFAAKAVDETLYAAYKMTVRPAAAVGTLAVHGTKVLYKGVELGFKSSKLGRDTIRTFKATGKTLKVGIKTLKLGRDMIRAAAGEGSPSKEPLTQEEKEQMRKERKMRRQAELEKERKRQEAREREEQEEARKLEEYHQRVAAEEAQRLAEEEVARRAAQVEAERREAAEAAAAQQQEPEPDHHQTLTDAISNEEVESVKNYSKDDLQKILDTHEQLLNGTDNGTAFESLHENSVSDLQKFAEGKVTIDKDSYATMVPFIKTFGTDDKGQLTEVGRAAQQKLTSLMTGGNSGGSSSGSTGIPH